MLKRKRKPRANKMNCYSKRDARISDLGYAGYCQFLKSTDWQVIRSSHLKKYPDCILCGNLANNVHHLSYDFETLLGLKGHRLVQLCEICHKTIEFDGERKRSLREANTVLFGEAAKTERGQRWLRWKDHREDEFRRKKRRNKKRVKSSP